MPFAPNTKNCGIIVFLHGLIPFTLFPGRILLLPDGGVSYGSRGLKHYFGFKMAEIGLKWL